MKRILIVALAAIHARAFMSDGPLPTVIVEGANGEPMMINQSDYDADPSAYTLVGAPAAAPAVEPAAAPAVVALPGKVLVSKEGAGAKARFFLTDEAGTKLVGEGIEDNGYDTDALAWEAALKVSTAPAT